MAGPPRIPPEMFRFTTTDRADLPWDAGLAEVLSAHGIAVPEELVAETLLADLEKSLAARLG